MSEDRKELIRNAIITKVNCKWNASDPCEYCHPGSKIVIFKYITKDLKTHIGFSPSINDSNWCSEKYIEYKKCEESFEF